MAGFLEVDCGSALYWLKTLQKLGRNDFCSDLDTGFDFCSDLDPGFEGSGNVVEENKFRCLFDCILTEFLKSTCKIECFRPLPPMLGSGETVDLVKLYLVVREKGGYETVSENGLWCLVAEALGFGSCVGSALKLIYSKYLGKLDLWSRKIVSEKDLKGAIEDSELMEVDTEVSEVVSDVSDPKKDDGGYPNPKTDKRCLDMDNLGNLCGSSSVLVNEGSNRKRKRESYGKMLSWIRNVARDPGDLRLESLPERSKWKNCGEEHLWKQVLIAREMMLLKRNAHLVANQSATNLGRRPMHPSMFEDSERVRNPRRVVPAKELSSKTQAPSESSSGTRSDLDDDFGKNTESLSADSVFFFLGDTNHRKRVPVGPRFQAHVPEWAKDTYESDSKWLGSRIWPLDSGEKRKQLVERERMGKGRQDSCGCQYRGSVECVRFHIAEKRTRVKLELGSAFFHWKFNKMGEEVALSWTEKEEELFQGVIRSNPPSLQKCFWDEIVKAFPSKKREELVSYYFNVFLLQCRRYQNRSTPSNIDSDDEESEFGSLADGFWHETGKSPSSIFYSPKKVHLNS